MKLSNPIIITLLIATIVLMAVSNLAISYRCTHREGMAVKKSDIPEGDEDLYILKSEIVPPVCPKCPDPIVGSSDDKFDVTKCPACPPCGRCPEPAFDCKKVPNYSSFNQNYMPVPVLSDFSSFGM